MLVREAMSRDVKTVTPGQPIQEAARIMLDTDIGALPVGENDRLVGMVTDRDIVCKGLTKAGFDPNRAMAREVMTSKIHCCNEEDDLAKAIRHMEELGVRRMPVINKSKRMVGMLSLGDVTHAAPEKLAFEYAKSVSAHHH